MRHLSLETNLLNLDMRFVIGLLLKALYINPFFKPFFFKISLFWALKKPLSVSTLVPCARPSVIMSSSFVSAVLAGFVLVLSMNPSSSHLVKAL